MLGGHGTSSRDALCLAFLRAIKPHRLQEPSPQHHKHQHPKTQCSTSRTPRSAGRWDMFSQPQVLFVSSALGVNATRAVKARILRAKTSICCGEPAGSCVRASTRKARLLATTRYLPGHRAHVQLQNKPPLDHKPSPNPPTSHYIITFEMGHTAVLRSRV